MTTTPEATRYEFACRRPITDEIAPWRYDSFVDAANDISNFARPDEWQVVERQMTPWVTSLRNYLDEIERDDEDSA